MADSFLWNEKYDILSAISDGRLMAWYYPNAIYIDKDINELCKLVKEATEIGRLSQIISFAGSLVTIRRKDGGLINLAVNLKF